MTLDEKENKIKDNGEKRIVKKVMRARTGRIPLHKQSRVSIDKEPGYHYHLVNDVPGRIDKFKVAGYEIVSAKVQEGGHNAQDASQIGKIASQSVGNGETAYYMRIPQEWHDEYQRDKQKRNDQIMNQIKHGFSAERPIANRRGNIDIDVTEKE